MRQHYINLLRIAQNKPKKGATKEAIRAYKEARQVVSAAMLVQSDTVCAIGNTNFNDEVMIRVSNIVLCPSVIEGYCTYLNELLASGGR